MNNDVTQVIGSLILDLHIAGIYILFTEFWYFHIVFYKLSEKLTPLVIEKDIPSYCKCVDISILIKLSN